MKKQIKKNKLIPSDKRLMSGKGKANGVFAIVGMLLAFALIVGGSIFSFAMAIKDYQKLDNVEASDSDVTSSHVLKDVKIPNEKMQLLDQYDSIIGEIDKSIKSIDSEINEFTLSNLPEKKVYVKELYDKRAGMQLSKSMLCKQYSNTCLEWARETRASLAGPIAEYEGYCELYKERLSAVYESGFPDFGDIFGTSNTVMDFVMGKVLLDEVRAYDRELADKVADLYAVVEDGLALVKYYLARSENYSNTQTDAESDFYVFSAKSSKHILDISAEKDVYNYLLQYYAQQDQIFAKQLADIVSKNTDAPGKRIEYAYPVGSEYFYTDYIGCGHESRIEWSVALGKYVNVFHSGIDIHTALRYSQINASADGKVIYADYCPSRGYTVALLHVDGIVTVYSGCSLLNVKNDDEVKAGDTLAWSGMRGDSNEFKVTFEVFEGGEFVDPKNYIAVPDVSLSGS